MHFRLLLLLILFSGSAFPVSRTNFPVYVYKGYITVNEKRNVEINLNFLINEDRTITGLYYYRPEFGSLRLTGKISPDNSVTLVETNGFDKVTGSFSGVITPDKAIIKGMWQSPDNHAYPFSIKHEANHSFWGYIQKFNKLREFKELKPALRSPEQVERLNLSDGGVKRISFNFSKMKNMTSAVFMADELKKFPEQLTCMPRLEEISFASNNLTKIPPEICRLKNLRVLIVDFNHLNSLPKKIGELHNLLYLDISGNNISSLPGKIANLYQLQELHAGSNSFSKQEMVRIRKMLPNCTVYF